MDKYIMFVVFLKTNDRNVCTVFIGNGTVHLPDSTTVPLAPHYNCLMIMYDHEYFVTTAVFYLSQLPSTRRSKRSRSL